MLEQLKTDINSLISLYEKEKSRADALEVRLQESEKLAESYQKQIFDLNGQIDTLKLSFAFTSSGDNTAAKERIDRLVREIDKCIKLLEKEN